MDSNLGSIRPYPSAFPPCPGTSPTGRMAPLLHALASDTSASYISTPMQTLGDTRRKTRTTPEKTWRTASPPQTPRIPATLLATLPSPTPTPVSPDAKSWNETKRRKLAHVSSTAQQLANDTLASSALASLSLNAYSHATTLEAMSLSAITSNYQEPLVCPPSISSSPPISPQSLSSRISNPLSSSSEVSSSSVSSPMQISSSPLSSPPSSPTMVKKTKIEIRHKGKQLKSRCTCCHVCRTSLKNYPRNHLDCTGCNAVVCQPCIEFRLSGASWEVASKESNWLCPSCLGTCVCPRCVARPLEIVAKSQFTQKRKADNTLKNQTSDAAARAKRLEELLEYYRQRDRFIHEIQNVLCIVKRDQREIEYQIAALQNQETDEEEEQ